LKIAKKTLESEVEELRSRVKMLTEQAEMGKQHPQKIAHLSKNLLRLGKLAVEYQESYEKLKRDNQASQRMDVLMQETA
jgi:hypothetical protein